MIRSRMSLKAMLALVAMVAAWLMVIRPYMDPNQTRQRARQLSRGDAQARREAAAGLIWASADEADLAVDALRRGLRDRDPEVRAESARSLGAILPPPADRPGANPGEVPIDPGLRSLAGFSLVLALRDRSPTVRAAAARSLPGLGALPQSAVAPLVKILRSDPDAEARAAAARTLGDPTTLDDPTLGELIGALRDDPDPVVRVNVIHSLTPFAGFAPVFEAMVCALGSGLWCRATSPG